MVVAKVIKARWIRKYKLFFIIGGIILSLQIFLAAKFLSISKATTPQKVWYPQIGNTLEPFVINKKILSTNSTVLRLEELDFQPECDIKGKEAISAIHRAKTQICKQLIANMTCRSLLGDLYPRKLLGLCPSDGRVYNRPLGCFKDESSYRLLNGYFGVNKGLNSPEYCVNLCLQSGFPFAGVQYSNECFCGSDEPPFKAKLPDSSCNMKCPGDPHDTCGGYYTINVYETGIRRFVAQVANTDFTKSDEESVRIVFLLTLNGRALRQVKRLLKILYNKKHYYYIHVDVREDYLFRELLPLEKQFPNIRLTRRRFATIWGGASLLEMLLSSMNELLKMYTWEWDFVLNLSESDYPVKPIASLERFLTANRGRNFVKSHGRDTQRFLQKQGLDKTFVECDMRMWRVADRKLPAGIQMDGGSDWIALSKPFVKYVAAKEPDALVSGLLQIFRHTLLPAESFFHTALRNSVFCDTYVDNNLHVTNWKRKLGCKCQYKHVVDWCGCSPNDFRPDDWPRIQTTHPKQLFFARKFEPIINQAVILKLELWLHGLEKPTRQLPNLHGYWQNLYHHLDLSPFPPDDGLITIINAAKRNWVKSITSNISDCSISAGKPLQVTSYHFKDKYKYTLVHFEVASITNKFGIEIAFKPLDSLLDVVSPSFLSARLEEFIVSSDYDQKEQLSRNFIRILSPYSDPVLSYRFSQSGATNMRNGKFVCLWIDPRGRLADVSQISIDEKSVIGHVKPILKQPHLPGKWTVKLVNQGATLIELKFLITPFEVLAGGALSEKQTVSLHGGSTNLIKNLSDDYGKNFLAGKFDEGVLAQLSASNSRKVGKDLLDWIDELFGEFYVVEKICAVNKLSVCDVAVSDCLRSDWSSFSPDPKSGLGNFNQTGGAFDIW